MSNKECKSCGYIGKPHYEGLDIFLTDVLVWLVAGSAAVMTGIIPLIIIAPIWTFIHLTWYHHITCPRCGEMEMGTVHEHDDLKKIH